MSVNTPLPSLNPRFPRWMEHARSGCLYPDLYTWFVFFAAMDVMLTWTILALGGREINGFADRVIDRFGLSGALCLKFGAVSLVLIICETIGRRQYRTGRQLASFAIAIYLLPVAVALAQMATSPKTRAEYWEQTDEALPAEISGVSGRSGELGIGNWELGTGNGERGAERRNIEHRVARAFSQ